MIKIYSENPCFFGVYGQYQALSCNYKKKNKQEKLCVRSGIRTHAWRTRLRPERLNAAP